MRILHTSDWHIGIRIGEYNLIDEQRYALQQIINIARNEHPDAIIVAGDVYDRAVPSAEAVMLFDEILVELASLKTEVFIIAGNHDSAERLAYASRLISLSHIHISPVYNGIVEPIVLKKGDEQVAFYLLPHLKPAIIRHFAEDECTIESYNDAMRYVVEKMPLEEHCCNVLIAHQFITNSERTDSEDMLMGGLDNIDSEVISRFDYVALGHLHRAQSCSCPTIRYSGTPMKYSFSEAKDVKSVSIIDIIPSTTGEKHNEVTIRNHPITPLHEWYDLRGTYDQLTSLDYYRDTNYTEAFVRITLTDEEDIPNGQRMLKAIYHRLVELRYDNTRTCQGVTPIGLADTVRKQLPIDLMNELYLKQNGQVMSEQQQLYMQQMIEQVFQTDKPTL